MMRDKMLYVAFGRRFNPSALTAAREAAGYTKSKLAQEVFGKSLKTGFVGLIVNYERGRNKPRLDTLRALCEVLEVKLDDLAPKVEVENRPQHTIYKIRERPLNYHPSWHWG